MSLRKWLACLTLMAAVVLTVAACAPLPLAQAELMSVADLRMLSLDLFEIEPGYLYIHDLAGPITPDLMRQTASEDYAAYLESLPRYSGYQSIWMQTNYDLSIRDLTRRTLVNQVMAFEDEATASGYLPAYQKFYRYPLNPIEYPRHDDETTAYYSKIKLGRFVFDVYHVLIRQNNIVVVVQFTRAPASDDIAELDDYVQYLAHRMAVYSPN